MQSVCKKGLWLGQHSTVTFSRHSAQITGRPVSELHKVSACFVGKKGLKIKARALYSHMFIPFQGFNCIPGCSH